MDNKAARDFAVKFNELSLDNQRYIIAIQEALAYTQLLENRAEKEMAKPTMKRVPDHHKVG